MFELSVPFWQWGLAFLVVMFGALVQTSIGFGISIVAAPILVFINPAWVPTSLLIAAISQLVPAFLQQRRGTQWRGLRIALLARIPGTLVGIGLLLVMTVSGLMVMIGAATLIGVVLSLTKVRLMPTDRNLGWAGFVSAIMGTTTSIGGPPMALVMQHADAVHLRANLTAYFLVGALISFAAQWSAGYVTNASVLAGLLFVPASLIGFGLGSVVVRHIPVTAFRYGIIVLCGIAGTLALVQGFLMHFEFIS